MADDLSATLSEWLRDARERTLRLVEDLHGDEQWLGPRLSIVNPPRWELGHLGWFQERWCLRDRGRRPSIRADADALYDSAAVPHQVRWDLPLPTPEATRGYVGEVLERVLERVERGGLSPQEAYFARLVVFHEDMHAEALLYTRQTHGWRPPRGLAAAPLAPGPAPMEDVTIPGGEIELGARPGEDAFVFDNEKWAHPVQVAPFAIARHALSEGEMQAFVEDGGYGRRELWSAEGWAWREREGASAPLYWRKDGGRWWRRVFDRWVPVAPGRAMVHLAWHEAQAWCAWADRRLPSEAEWEMAAAAEPQVPGGKRPRPWGAAPAEASRANLGARLTGPGDVDACPDGDSAWGLRQTWGNVWEWTADAFGPYPGFVVDPYAEYSAPWFGNHRVLRGGCFATQARLLRNTWRNFYTPDRRDVWAGARTCRHE